MMRRLGISSIALALVVLPATARAQIGGSGSIQGSILDASGAALPGATVTATHLSTGVDTVRQATGAGVYTVSPLAPGDYRVTVVLQGFQTFVQESVTVDALGVVGLNVTLKVGGITQEVTVSASPPMLRTADGRLGQTIRNDVYTALPLVMNTGGPARPDRVHVPDARRAVGRPLGQRDGRPGLHQRDLRRGRADHQRRGAGRGPQPVDGHLGRGHRSVPGRDQRHRRHVQRPGRVELRREVGHQPVPRQRLRVLPQQGAGQQGVLRRHQAGRQPARVRLHARRTAPPQPGVLLRRPTTAIAIAGRPSRG